MTNQKYVTGRRFKAKIQGVDYGELILKKCTAGCDWWDLFDMNGNCIICMREGDSLALSALGITELILLPDTEPQKGDAVEVSDDGQKWLNQGRTYTGFNYEGQFITMNRDNYFSGWKHIRLAKPIPTERELAEKKATNWMEENNHLLKNKEWRSQVEALTEYILKNKNLKCQKKQSKI